MCWKNGESVTISFDEYVANSELSLLEIKDKFYGKNKIQLGLIDKII